MAIINENACDESYDDGMLRFYFDQATKPLSSLKPSELFSARWVKEDNLNPADLEKSKGCQLDEVGTKTYLIIEPIPPIAFGLEDHMGGCLSCAQRWEKMERKASPEFARASEDLVKAVSSENIISRNEAAQLRKEALVRMKAAHSAIYQYRI